MKIFKLLFVFGFFLTLFLQTRVVYAALDGFNSDCLDPTVLMQRVPSDPQPTPRFNHAVTLSFPAPGTGHLLPQANVNTYVFVCVTTKVPSEGKRCTTGLPDIDYSLFGKRTDYDFLAAMPIYKEIGGVYKATNNIAGVYEEIGGNGSKVLGENPTKTTNDAANPQFANHVVWYDIYGKQANEGLLHQFFWLQAASPGPNDGVGSGNEGALQQATFNFGSAIPNNSKCAIVGWDPRGYVFEAKTLNPVKDVMVMLSKGTSGGIFTDVASRLGLTNPDKSTSTNGQYSFYVDPGFYKLRLVSSNAVIAVPADINPVSQSLFFDKNGKTNIYKEGGEVEEMKGSVKIAHIPVTVADPNLLITTLNVLEKGSEGVGKQLHIFGRVSHPKSKMILTMTVLDANGKSKDIVKMESTDDLGEYDKFIDQEQIDETTGKKLLVQNLNVSFAFNSFYTTGLFSHNRYVGKIIGFLEHILQSVQTKLFVNAGVTTAYNVKPIPTYIEGIAYDVKGIAIPKAIVGAYPFFSENPMYMTIADETGKYKIGSQHLPKVEYKLRYKKLTGDVIVVDTGTFIKQNATLFASASINPFAQKQTTLAEDAQVKEFFLNINTKPDLTISGGGKVSNTSVRSSPSNLLSKASSSRDQVSSGVHSTGIIGEGMQGVVMIIIVIMVLLMLGMGTFLILRARQQAPPLY